MSAHDAVILAGGAARRLGGADKPAVRVGGRTLLDRVVDACGAARRVVVVGPRRPSRARVVWTREEPPGGGPLAALAAGLRAVEAPLVLVLAADLPFLTPAGLARLLDLPPDADVVLPRDAAGRDQPLSAVYRAEPLRRELALLATEYGTLAGLPLKLLLPGLRAHRVAATDDNGGLDCDTWADIVTARTRIRDDMTVLDEWLAAVKADLGIELDVDIKALLDAARDAAHSVARPAAPLTTFLIGYAVAQQGIAPADAAARISALALKWAEESEGAGEPGAAT
ncbi:NTP transferase domain-containing protein [Streptomyces millisiae]|uniref:NTP transferase domain-containing protein n=1 Tax=Streptomyces millisiae TaxID=3075542 RepID=A0ABU2LTF3_9ACTN|nr:NTP transferase domain-containing protein [Streptomyces sp. DSM 44918]MDT0320875.1 NTP transferase domain-containing protein [Streptomyces sp. DSM 44918]